MREGEAKGAVVRLRACLLEADLLENGDAGVVPYLDEGPQHRLWCVLPMPINQRLGDLSRKSLAPELTVDRVAEAPPCVVAAEAGPAYEGPVVTREPPLRPASLAMLRHVLLYELLGLRQRLRSSQPDEAHGVRVGVHFKQLVDVGRKPGRQD